MEITVYDPKKRKRVLCGYLDKKKKTFKRNAKHSHQLRVPPAWCIQKIIFDKLKTKVDTWIIKEIDTNITYYTSTKNFLSYGTTIDRGHGKQLMLPLKYWDKKDKKQLELF